MRRLVPVEVYPLVASVAAAVAASAYALKRKWFNDPGLTVSKSRRSGGTSVAYEGVDDAQPFWAGLVRDSGSMFSSKPNQIFMINRMPPGETYVATFPAATDEVADEAEPEDEEESIFAPVAQDGSSNDSRKVSELEDQAFNIIESTADLALPEPVKESTYEGSNKDDE